MSVGAGDGSRLRRIEDELLRDDPSFVARFRSWGPADGPGVLPGWSVLPRWIAVIFLVGLTTWLLSPVLGTVVAAVGGLWWLRKRAAARAGAVRRPGVSRRRR